MSSRSWIKTVKTLFPVNLDLIAWTNVLHGRKSQNYRILYFISGCHLITTPEKYDGFCWNTRVLKFLISPNISSGKKYYGFGQIHKSDGAALQPAFKTLISLWLINATLVIRQQGALWDDTVFVFVIVFVIVTLSPVFVFAYIAYLSLGVISSLGSGGGGGGGGGAS